MKHKFFILYSFLFLIFLFGIVFSVQASIGLSISPQKFELVVFPGDSYKAWFKLGNRSEIPLSVSVRAVPFGAEDGTGEMLFEKLEPDSPSFWVKFETPDLILEPGETRHLDFQINVPADAEPGSYYVFVYFEPRLPSYYFEEMGPKVVPVVGVPFLISTTPLLLDPEEGKEFEVAKFSIAEEERVLFLESAFKSIRKRLGFTKSIALADTGGTGKGASVQITRTQPTKFTVRLQNNDIYHIKPFGTLSIYNAFGNKIGEAELKAQSILPGKSRDFNIELKEAGPDHSSAISASFFNALGENFIGKYRAELDVRALSPVRGEVLPIGGISSIVFFSLTSFYFLFVFIIITVALYFGRKRIKVAFRALIKLKK